MKSSTRKTILETIIVLLVSLFLYTGICKIKDYLVFKEQIAMSPILVWIAPFIAAALPWAEFTVVILLIVPRWRLKGFYASVGLLIIFTAYIVAILIFNKDIPCSCGGVIELLSWDQHIIFNSIFIALAGVALKLERGLLRDNKLYMASLLTGLAQ